MNQWCKVCDEPAAGFHFGAFTCEGCKSFFGRAHTNPGAAATVECKTGDGRCVIDKKNRTSCKACRLKKCLLVGMSKSGSRYGRRSNWFKMHCLLQQQQLQRRGIDRTDRCGGGGDDDKNSISPTDHHAQPRSPFPLQQHPPAPVTTLPLLFGFAPKSRAPLPRSERSAFRETSGPGGRDLWRTAVAGHDDDDDRPIDLTVRQKFGRDDDDDDDNNNNETADGYDSALLRRLHRDQHDTTAPLDLTRS